MMRSLAWVAVATLGLGAGVGCGDGGSESEPAVTWHRDVRPIVERSCVGCHTPGGIGPFSLQEYETAFEFKDRIADQVATRTMPPWLAGPGCSEYDHDPSLPQEEIDTIVQWVDLGAPEGNPADAPAPEQNEEGLSRVDMSLEMPELYVQQIEPDDYRCFLIDWPEDTVKYVTGFRANPGNAAVVHHVIAFLVTPDEVAQYQAYDDAEPGAGYTCFGGPAGPGGQSGANIGWIGAWAPGSQGSDFPAGTGMRIEPGSKIALQVHYNSQTSGAAPDLTSIDLRLEDQVDKEAFTLPWANPGWLGTDAMRIPAGEADVTHSFSFDPTAFLPGQPSFTIYSAALHMHQLGESGTLKIHRSDGTDECMLDVPRWDFHWQLAYGFTEPKVFHPGDQLSIECHWDNTAANQPEVHGERQEPRDVTWGEGSTDEMCLGVFYVTGM